MGPHPNTQAPPVQLWLSRIGRSSSLFGLFTAVLFFSASLTPSLVPREALVQGVLSGISLGVGYGIGVLITWLWFYLQLPRCSRRVHRFAVVAGVLVALGTMTIFLWRATAWQDSIRELMGAEPASGSRLLQITAVAVMVFVLLRLLAALFRLLARTVSKRLRTFLPQRLSSLLAVSIAAVLFGLALNGIVFRQGLHMVDASYQALDALSSIEIKQPSDDWKAGSAASFVDWESMGRAGREYVSTGPSREDINAWHPSAARDPLRVYVGLRSAPAVEERARLALEELKRIGGFDRSVLIVATPTGTGWMDPQAVDALEYLHAGDVATVALQYSYLASWLSLMIEPGYGAESSKALFAQVYGYWNTLPEDDRPRLYLFGLSLGALASEKSVQLYQVLENPHHGAVWAGPPFASTHWRSITDNRETGSPFWLPRFGDGSFVRFTSQQNTLQIDGAEWGPMRIAYLQYASDAITFFEPSIFYRRPEWLEEPRGPDVSPELRWYPIITGLQVAVDTMLAADAPAGFAHHYAAAHYADAWLEVTEPPGWDPARLARLKDHLSKRHRDD